MLIMRLKSNSPDCTCETRIRFMILYRNDSASVQSRCDVIFFGCPPCCCYRVECAVPSLQTQNILNGPQAIANPHLDTWHSGSVYPRVRYLLSCFALVTCFLVWNLTYYEPNILLVMQHTIVPRPVIKNYIAIVTKSIKKLDIGRSKFLAAELRLCEISYNT